MLWSVQSFGLVTGRLVGTVTKEMVAEPLREKIKIAWVSHLKSVIQCN